MTMPLQQTFTSAQSIHVQVGGNVNFPAVHRQCAWSLMPVTLLYVGNVAFALMSLQNLNIPMYNTLKRMTPVIVLVVKVC